MLKAERIFDARPSLWMLGHPAAVRRTPVWSSHHDRAVAEVAFRNWTTGLWVRWPVAPWVVADWLGTEAQMRSLRGLEERLETCLPDGLVDGWHRCLKPRFCAFGANSDFLFQQAVNGRLETSTGFCGRLSALIV